MPRNPGLMDGILLGLASEEEAVRRVQNRDAAAHGQDNPNPLLKPVTRPQFPQHTFAEHSALSFLAVRSANGFRGGWNWQPARVCRSSGRIHHFGYGSNSHDGLINHRCPRFHYFIRDELRVGHKQFSVYPRLPWLTW